MSRIRTVISEHCIEKYTVLRLDDAIPRLPHKKYLIDGVVYDIVSMYDAVNCIAIEASGGFVGKTVEFVL